MTTPTEAELNNVLTEFWTEAFNATAAYGTRFYGRRKSKALENATQALQAYIQEQIRLARISELESITGFSDVGGVRTNAGGETVPIRERLDQLRNQEGKHGA